MKSAMTLVLCTSLLLACSDDKENNICSPASVEALKKLVIAQNEYIQAKDSASVSTTELDEKLQAMEKAKVEALKADGQCSLVDKNKSERSQNLDQLSHRLSSFGSATDLAAAFQSVGINFNLETRFGSGTGGVPSYFGNGVSSNGPAVDDNRTSELELKALKRLAEILLNDPLIREFIEITEALSIQVSNPYTSEFHGAEVYSVENFNDKTAEFLGLSTNMDLSLRTEAFQIREAIVEFRSRTEKGAYENYGD